MAAPTVTPVHAFADRAWEQFLELNPIGLRRANQHAFLIVVLHGRRIPVGLLGREPDAHQVQLGLGAGQVGRARESGETRGFMKILVDADSKEILGAALLGLAGDEAVHALLDIMYAQQPYTVVSRAVHIHPTVSELIPTVLQSLRPLE